MLLIKNTQIGYAKTLLHIDELLVEPGKLYALIGRNGVGKSSLLKSIIGDLSLRKGSISIEEKELEKITKKEISKLVSLVPARFNGVENLTVFDYLMLGRIPYSSIFGTTSIQDNEQVENVISLLQLEHLRTKFTVQLSDGEKQLISIAQSLVQQTKIVLLDEPTAFLDYENKWKILTLLKKCTIQEQLGTIFSSHDIEMSMEVADYLLLVNPNNGKLICFPAKSSTKEDVIKMCFPSL
jgi:iron complex transport system ATP-binding protein